MASGYSEKKKKATLSRNPEQMRIAVDNVIFQPIVRVDVPQFAGLQTPLAGGTRQRVNSAGRTIPLPRYTAVKVLANTGGRALVQLKNGERGYVPTNSLATESAILATAQPATLANPVVSNMPTDPSTGQPYDPQTLYLPTMDAGDAPVDQAMLNNIDSIPLPESEIDTPVNPEGQEVDGIILRSPSPTPTQ